MNQTITLKLKPYLQEYLLCKFNPPEISNKNIIGALMSPFIEYIPADYVPCRKTDPEYFTMNIKLGGNKVKDARRGIYISEENQKEFERLLRIHFQDILFSYLDDKLRYKRQIKKCILQFCADYNITFNNMNYETLKKSYYRNNIKKKTAGKQSLNCPLIFI